MQRQTFRTVPTQAENVQLSTPFAASVFITWEPPHRANGIILQYSLYRKPRESSAHNVVTIATFFPNEALHYLDQDQHLSPFTVYYYSVGVTNDVGESVTEWFNITTKPARESRLLFLLYQLV